jgi:DNA-binding MarR family transcriptional regulator
MKLEDEIKQEKFESMQQKAILNIMVTNNWLLSLHSKFFKKFGLSPAQYNVLRILRGANKPLKLNDISSRMLDKMSNATRLVDKLMVKKLVDRKVCDFNRRQVDIEITEIGIALMNQIDQQLKIFSSQFEHLSHENALLLNEILDNFRK